MTVTPINSLQEFQTIINSGKVVVIDFWATQVEFYKVDVDTQQDIAQEVGIKAMPTFVAFKDGDKIEELVGANPSKLTALVQKLV